MKTSNSLAKVIGFNLYNNFIKACQVVFNEFGKVPKHWNPHQENA